MFQFQNFHLKFFLAGGIDSSPLVVIYFLDYINHILKSKNTWHVLSLGTPKKLLLKANIVYEKW